MNVTSDAVFRTTQGQPITARWAYDPADPHAIQLRLNGTVWEFGRELLELALSRRCRLVGDGDIQLHAGLPGPRLWVTLRPPGGVLRVSCPLAAVESFVDTVCCCVPACDVLDCGDPVCAQCAPVAAELDAVLAGIFEETA